MRLSPEASREVIAELNRPAADTPERRYTFGRLAEMKRKNRERQIRRCLLFLAVAGALFAVMWGCASVPVEGSYPIPVYIHNGRYQENDAPHFYLVGLGRHPLGMIQSEGKASIESRWIPPEGMLVVAAKYLASPEIVSAPFPWHPGESVFISLNAGGEILVAWSHR